MPAALARGAWHGARSIATTSFPFTFSLRALMMTPRDEDGAGAPGSSVETAAELDGLMLVVVVVVVIKSTHTIPYRPRKASLPRVARSWSQRCRAPGYIARHTRTYMTEGKKVQTDPTTRKYTAPDVPYTTDIQGQGPARVFSMTHVSEEEAPVRHP